MATKRNQRRLVITAVAVVLLGASPGFGLEKPAPDAGKTEMISLGMISYTHRNEIAKHNSEFAHYVARKLFSDSNVQAKVVVVKTPGRLAELLEQREVDFYMESPYATYVINDQREAGKLLLRRWKGGSAEYQSLIFTREDSEIESLESLQGKAIVFEDPGSTSAYFLPKAFLAKKGFELSKKDRPVKDVSSDEVGYIFALTPGALFDVVLEKKAAAGAFSSGDYAALDDEKKASIKILARTGTVPRHLVSVRKDMAPELVDRLKEILLAMHTDEEGRRILKNIDGTSKFDVLPGGEAQLRQQLLANFHIEVEK
jgi:phosphonate transport system substrate-binding protein